MPTYHSLNECVLDLEKHGHLIRIRQEVDPYLEMAEIHRRVYQAGGPAIFYEKVKGSPFPAVSNLFGTLERSRFIFRDALERVKKLVELKAQPFSFFKNPMRYLDAPLGAFQTLPRQVSNGPVMAHQTTIDQLPQIQSWPDDGGPYILLPQVYTEDQDHSHVMHSNLGMYRIQLSGNDYAANKEIGLHYQIRRDIGIHHSIAIKRGEPLRVSIFVGGPPANSFAAVMYLPENLSELSFAGVLGAHRFPYIRRDGFVVAAEADFCITGYVDPSRTLPEGPFGDHLGYYSLKHPFPVMKVDAVYHREGAIWPFTVVGRPPQEDTSFGHLIQEIAGPILPKEIPGVKAVHAVDAAGVHPLMLAIGSERYTPYSKRRPQELLTLANALLGYGPCSLSKYLLIVAGEDKPDLDVHDLESYFKHLLERIDWASDLHFQTQTTMDTLDYSGMGLNLGSKVVMAACGLPKRSLGGTIPDGFKLPETFEKPQIVMPGVLAVQAAAFRDYTAAAAEIKILTQHLQTIEGIEKFPLMILADDSAFTAASQNNFLWITFTRSNPSHDIYGVQSFNEHKHWGCHGPLLIDARIKPHHAPPLIEDPAVTRKVDQLGAPGNPLHGII